jgi:hypothetical protein
MPATDRIEIQNDPDAVLKKELERISWPVDYGSVKIQVRNGRATLVTIERTVKMD